MTNKVLFVDDDPNVLAGYARALRKQFTFDTANGGEEALALMETKGPYAVIVADMRMPGMDGIQLLSKVRERWSDTVRIMLTGNADQQTAIDAVNTGNVYRFLTKPCPPENLGLAIEAGMKEYALVVGERELLENTLAGSIRVMMDILAAIDPRLFGRGQQLKEQMRTFLTTISGKSNWECELAATLSPIGYITVPPSVMQRAQDMTALTSTEKEMLASVPETGSSLISKIPRLEGVARIIRYLGKNYDGSGSPADAVAGEEIPVGARILKVLSDLLDKERQGASTSDALMAMQATQGQYDPRVLEIALKSVASKTVGSLTQPPNIFHIKLSELRPGYVLVNDIETVENVLVVSAGQRISPMMLELIRNFAKISGIKEPISVQA
jgi:response regulator RpfG family c-di-GMP phosphodiesterase